MNTTVIRNLATLAVCLASTITAGAQPALIRSNASHGDTNRLALGDARPFHQTTATIRNEKLIPVPDADALLITWTEQDAFGNQNPFYAISTDGREVQTVRTANYTLKLRHGAFDPASRQPAPLAALAADPHNGAYVVQFITQPLDTFKNQIEQLGGQANRFLAYNAYIVNMSPETANQVADLPYVRWVGPYHPAYKLEEQLLATFELGGKLPTQTYNIEVFQQGARQQRIVADRIHELGGTVENTMPQGFLMRATLDHNQLQAIAAMDEVHWIDRWFPPELDMDLAREIGGANFIQNSVGFTGQGVRAEVMDSNVRGSHVDFQSNPIIYHGPNSGSSSHGTSTFGIVFGDGTGNPDATGMLPDAQGIFADFDALSNRWTHTAQLLDPPYEAVFQSNSWGSWRTTSYTSESASLDNILFTYDILVTQSQSNAGNQNSRPQAWCKNIVSVGGINHYDNLNPEDDCWCGGASTGPAADGRIKPDLVHFYDSIFTVSSAHDQAYTQFCCTSGATPIVAGHFGIFFQMWHEGLFGNETSDTVFNSRPHMSTAKAIMIHTATQWPFSGSGTDLTRTHQGWGMPDLETLYQARDDLFIVDEADILANLESTTYEFSVSPLGSTPFRATMVYTDRGGTTSSTIHRINDLTLKVTAPDGTVHWGNNGLNTGNWSEPGGTPNDRDTVENVFVAAPAGGIWSVQVIAQEVNVDTHVETPEMDADYALVVSGGSYQDAGPCDGFTLADANCDGQVNNFDIDAFVLAITDPGTYDLQYPACDRICACDVNFDGTVDNFDIDAFVDCITDGGCN